MSRILDIYAIAIFLGQKRACAKSFPFSTLPGGSIFSLFSWCTSIIRNIETFIHRCLVICVCLSSRRGSAQAVTSNGNFVPLAKWIRTRQVYIGQSRPVPACPDLFQSVPVCPSRVTFCPGLRWSVLVSPGLSPSVWSQKVSEGLRWSLMVLDGLRWSDMVWDGLGWCQMVCVGWFWLS